MPACAALAVDEKLGKVELRQPVAGLGGGLHQRVGALRVLFHEPPVEKQQSVLELRLGHALLGGELVPFGGLGLVARDAEPARQDLGDERLRGGVAGFGARHGEIEGCHVEAALEGAVGCVGRRTAEALLADARCRAAAPARRLRSSRPVVSPSALGRRRRSGILRTDRACRDKRKGDQEEPAGDHVSDSLEARRGFVEDSVGARHRFCRDRRHRRRPRADSATKSTPVAATASTEAMSEPAITMTGTWIISAHQRPSVRLRVMRLRLVVVAETAEEDVIGTFLAKFQRIVAGLGAAGADGHLRPGSFRWPRQVRPCRPRCGCRRP